MPFDPPVTKLGQGVPTGMDLLWVDDVPRTRVRLAPPMTCTGRRRTRSAMRTADLSMREDPDHDRTIDALLRFGWFSGWQRAPYVRVAEIAISVRDDSRPAVRFGAMVPTMASSSHYETRYGKTESELRGTALGLITAGFMPTAIEVSDAPDSHVTIGDDSIWVGFAEVVDAPSARYTYMISVRKCDR